MKHSFWKGRNLDKRNRILILGESSYGDDLDCIGKDTPEDYSIGDMKCFLAADEKSYWHIEIVVF